MFVLLFLLFDLVCFALMFVYCARFFVSSSGMFVCACSVACLFDAFCVCFVMFVCCVRFLLD